MVVNVFGKSTCVNGQSANITGANSVIPSSTWTISMLLPPNTFSPTCFNEPGSVSSFSTVQPLNAEPSIVIKPSGSCKSVKCMQLKNAALPMDCKPTGRLTRST